MRQLAFSILIVLCFSAPCFAQGNEAKDATDSAQVNWRVETASSLSFTGLGSNLVLVGKYKQFETYVGPRLVISNTYGLSDNPWGISAGVRYYPNKALGHFQGFFNFDYQSAYYKNYCPFGNCGNDYNVTSEYSLGAGFRILLGQRFAGISSFHYSLYRERYDAGLNENLVITGYSGMIRLGLQYRFGKS